MHPQVESQLHPQVEQELAYLLLTELLAYQFASPVRWIETQDVFLDHQGIERFIEIGPSDVLTGMAKKTIASKYSKQDTARHINRKLMFHGKDFQEIHYESDAVPEPAAPEPTPAPKAAAPAPVNIVPVAAAPILSAPVAAAASVADTPVSAKDIITTIIALKLKKSVSEVPLDKNIKQLTGGRSTLENELVGDLGAEFGSIPEKPEELPLDELCSAIQNGGSFGGKLGKTSTGLMGKLFSLKMPGGYNPSVLRSHLSDRWGLGAGRQDSVIMKACGALPASRLGSAGDAQAYFDGIVQQYGKENGLSLGGGASSGSSGGPASPAGVMVDNKALEAVTEERDAFRRKTLELYAKSLGVDLRANESTHEKSQATIKELQGQLDMFDAELGDVFATGIKPMWSALKVRRFDSHWNWVVQETFELFYNVLSGATDINTSELASRSIRIANRSNPRLLEVMRYLMSGTSETWGPRFDLAKDLLAQLLRLCESTKKPSYKPLFAFKDTCIKAPRTHVDKQGKVQYSEVARSAVGEIASVHIKTKKPSGWAQDRKLTSKFLGHVDDIRQMGLSFQGSNVLLTGASPSSIGSEILIGLLSGSCRVVVTTSSYSPKVLKYYQELYEMHGAKGSELVVVPFNQGSQQDLDSLVSYIYDPSKGLGWDLDHIIPFAAIGEAGRQIDGIDSKSELAHRIMLTHTIRLLGFVKKQKETRGFHTRPAQVILPLSPNHGAFGSDGLYAESKIGLESLFDKWHSENWAAYLSICGAVIGWTRGTGLMADNNIVAAGIEELGVRTFSQSEMAFYILVLMGQSMALQSETQPLYADLTGGLDSIMNLKSTLDRVRRNVNDTSEVRRAIASEDTLDKAATVVEKTPAPTKVLPKANIQFNFPALPDTSELEALRPKLNGMVDLDRVVVVTGFSEVGPWGNARTRWEMEAHGRFSLEGAIEMAWIMGLIKHHDGPLEGKQYCGWIDAKSKKPVHDADVKAKYEAEILEHSGIRLVEPELDEGYDPKKKQFCQEVQLDEDMAPFSASKELAEQFVREHGDKVHLSPSEDGFQVYIKRGATLFIPKAIQFDRAVAGQIPAGWSAKTYGINDDIIQAVDRVTLFSLVSTVEALLSSGITDPYELYKYIHVSEIGNCIGSGIGGTASLKKTFLSRFLDRPAQNDVLAETFINTTAAWINMLLLSSSGPIRTPVGACATSIESVESGYETIVSGKAKMCLVGGHDDMAEAIAYEFANMKATSNSDQEFAKGRTPADMSRPTTTTRSGFMESQGSGVQVLTTASLALAMGLPIHGIVAFAGTSSDKVSRSVPAPGQGIMTNARQVAPSKFPSPLLSIEYRRKRLALRKKQIKQYLDTELQVIKEEFSVFGAADSRSDLEEEIKHRTHYVELEANRQLSEALNTWGNEFWKNNPQISPIAGSLAVWGLTVDDIDFASFHGTSTVLNDQNETSVLQSQLLHLGRTPGHPLFGIFQKYLTGHSKGAAGAWMLNGSLQALSSGLIPGNRAADNIDQKLEKNDMVFFPNRAIQTNGLKAFSVTSFGFGQKGAQAIGINAKYLFAAIDEKTFEAYKKKLNARHKKAFAHFQRGLATHTLFQAKDHPPYTSKQEKEVYLNPEARVTEHEVAVEGETYLFDV
ncbi:3-oxoacyl-synthase [Tricladium varicosporioides]|nr:3-oxoacyl-synthase [Hymenoscyphus varicosporioides]